MSAYRSLIRPDVHRKVAINLSITYRKLFFPTCYGPEFAAQRVRDWIGAVGAKTAVVEPGSPWENGHCERFDARFRDELLSAEVFHSLKTARIFVENRRRHFDTVRPHSSLGYRSPAPKSIVPIDQRQTMH